MSLSCSANNDPPTAVAGGEDFGVGEIMLFGVRVVVDSMRKSVSLNNLSQYEQPQESAINNGPNANNTGNGNGKEDVAPGYTSENDVVHNSGGNRERERKRGIPWTEEEHKLFLLGLQKVGKGDWRGISRNFVKTRTPTQVASHAQKYFIRRNNHNRRRRRTSLFDITTETVAAIPMEEDQVVHHQENVPQSHPLPSESCNPGSFSLVPTCPLSTDGSSVLPTPVGNPMENLTLGQKNSETNSSLKLVRPIAQHSIPHGPAIIDLSLNLKSAIDPLPLSLKLSLPSDARESSSARHSAFQSVSSFNNGDSIISVA